MSSCLAFFVKMLLPNLVFTLPFTTESASLTVPSICEKVYKFVCTIF